MSSRTSAESSQYRPINHTFNKQDHFKKIRIPKNVFVNRNSLLTDLMLDRNFHPLFKFYVTMLVLLLLNVSAYYLNFPKVFWADVSLASWASGNFLVLLKLWLSFNLFAFVIFQGFKSWIRIRSMIHTKIVDATFLTLYLIAIVFMFTATCLEMMKHEVRPLTNLTISCEQVRIFMKVHSFVRENVPRVLQYKPETDGDQELALSPTFKQYLYFLFAPTLIYRDSYPRREKISWKFVGNQLFTFFSCIFIAYCGYTRIIVDNFRNIGTQQYTLEEASVIIARVLVLGILVPFMILYMFMHSWMNAFAELMKFGDRDFYQDWWACSSFSEYYRKWNMIVNYWLHSYVYLDLRKMGFRKNVSLWCVFFVSAIGHEYVFTLTLGFFYPVVIVVYSTCALPLMILTKERTTHFWKNFVWIGAFFLWNLIVCLYAIEWYARVNCKILIVSSMEFFTPRSWDRSCHILSYTS